MASIASMETEVSQPLPAPRTRPFPCLGNAPGPRCGHTLTAISGPEGDFSSAKLVLCGEHHNYLMGCLQRHNAVLARQCE